MENFARCQKHAIEKDFNRRCTPMDAEGGGSNGPENARD
jgi:hypothetical protein